MASPVRIPSAPEEGRLPILLDDIPLLYEDQEDDEMGESDFHAIVEDILRYGLRAHLASRSELRVFTNLNLYYNRRKPKANVAPDAMVVAPTRVLVGDVSSYRIGQDGPAPILAGEILSPRTAEDKDLGKKLKVYAKLGVPEYILVDLSGRFLPERLVLKRLQSDRTWLDERDSDGGITSRLGFRVTIDVDGWLRVVNAATGDPYARPDEAQATANALQQTQERLRQLEAEIERLRTTAKKSETKKRRRQS